MASRIEAWNGSTGFDFAATYICIDPHERIEFRFDDDRVVNVEFLAHSEGTLVRESFDAEDEMDVKFQRQGWQAILDYFARYVEKNEKT